MATSQREERPPRGNGSPAPQQMQATAQPGAAKARLQCHACLRLLEYDAGAQYVQCFSCSTMNAVQARTPIGGRVLSMLCAICHTTNLAPYGTTYVRCGSCVTISQADRGLPQNQQSPAQAPEDPPMQMQQIGQQDQTNNDANLQSDFATQQSHQQAGFESSSRQGPDSVDPSEQGSDFKAELQ